ncbi:hypothetical protein BY996DRAFT_2482674 [Phakopsora pachyrhizi]|nr:hypothetical protein BY996DRAFT_2482674 [Phakopsora pachyrhizi]
MSISDKTTSPPSSTSRSLSSPFRDRRGISIASPSHVIDISPSPPIENMRGRFEVASSDATRGFEPDKLKRIEIRKPKFKNMINKASHEAIGLGLGIHTGGESLESLIGATQATSFSGKKPKATFFKGSRLGIPALKGSSRKAEVEKFRFRSNTYRRISTQVDQGYVAEDEDDFRNYEVNQDCSLRKRFKDPNVLSAQKAGPVLVASKLNPLKTPLLYPRGKPMVVPMRENENILLLTKDSHKDKNIKVFESISSQSSINKATSLPYFIKPLDSKGRLLENFLRHRTASKRAVESDNAQPVSSTNSQSEISRVPDVSNSSVPNTSNLTYTSATPALSPSPIIQAPQNAESPLLLPSSPVLAVHSPMLNLRDAPGSYSPSAKIMTAFSSPILNTSGTSGTHMSHETTPFLFTMLAGGLGIFGIFLIILAWFWKKNISGSGLGCWKRKTRGTAYDEFMEDEKGWWLGQETDEKPTKRISANSSSDGSDIKSKAIVASSRNSMKFPKSASQAPSIPPIAHLANGKISFDTIQINLLSRPSSIESMKSFHSGTSESETSEKKYNFTHRDSKFLTELEFIPEVCELKTDSSAQAKRNRSDSKSSVFSKASKKSITSIASFILNKAKLENFGTKKKLVDLGISNENYKHYSLNKYRETVQQNVASPVELLQNQAILEAPEHLVSFNAEAPIYEFSSSFSSKGISDSSVIDTTSPQIVFEKSFLDRRSSTLTFTPPAILITDHPSALIPPPPPPPPPASNIRPISILTLLKDYSTANYKSESNLRNDRLSSGSIVLSGSFSDVALGERERSSTGLMFEETAEFVKGSSKRSRVDGTHILSSKGAVVNDNQFTQSAERIEKFASKRSSLASVTSSKTIVELAAVTEDLRALIDADASAEYSWHSPSQFHVSVPDRPPNRASTRSAPTRRSIKSVKRYRPKKTLSIEYESRSTPSSPTDLYDDNSREISVGSVDSIPSDWSLDVISPSTKPFRHVSKPKNSRKKSESGSSLDTVMSAESNSSLYEIASLHTACAIHNSAMEYVLRSPAQPSSRQGSQMMMSIIEEIDNDIYGTE